MDYSKLTPLLVEAVNALKRNVDRKDARIGLVRNKNVELEARLAHIEAMLAPANGTDR